MTILIVGGKGEQLNPALIYLNEDMSAGFESYKCENCEERINQVSDFLDDTFAVCGGTVNNVVSADCKMIDETGAQIIKMIANGRRNAASVRMNNSMMWITGGINSDNSPLESTEFVTTNGSTPGPTLPYDVFDHCMVQYKPNAIIQISGELKGFSGSKYTLIFDPTNDYNWTFGPKMMQGRMDHSCGKIRDEFGNDIIIVAGGDDEKNYFVEILNTTRMDNWTQGICYY